ncbi:putative cystine transporter YijE [anaerobic digester metagenome]
MAGRDETEVAVRLVFVGLVWGAAYVAGRYVAGEMTPFSAVATRSILASLCLGLVLAASPRGTRTVARADLPAMIFLGLSGVFGFNVLFFLGLESTGAVNGTLIGAMNPVLTALLAALLLRERLGHLQWLGVVLSFVGVLFVVSNGSPETLLALSLNRGDLLLFAAVICWAVYSVAGRRLFRRYPAVTVTAYAYFVSTALVLPLALVESAGAIGPMLPESPIVWAALLFLATLCSVLGFIWWNRGVAVLGPSRTAVFYNLVPVSGIVLGSLLLGEVVTLFHLAGATLVCTGVYLAVRKTER